MLEHAGHVALAGATAHLRRGQAQREAKAFEAASRSLLAGIEALGTLYRDRESLDDTGLKLTLARSQLAKGDLEAASAVLRGVLESRISLYRRARLMAPAVEGAPRP